MIVLGISAFFHDSSACLVDTEHGIVAAAEEERFSRIKHDNSFPIQAINFCIEKANVKKENIDLIVFYEEPWTKFNRIMVNYVLTRPRSDVSWSELVQSWLQKKLWIPELISETVGVPIDRIRFTQHHLAHAYAAYGPSGYSDAACMTLDGVGEFETATFGLFKEGKYRKIKSHYFPHSIGLLYSSFAEFLGFEVNDGEFKVMGMAAYGNPIYRDKIQKLIIDSSNLNFKLDMQYFSFNRSKKTNLSKKFMELFGPRREPEAKFLSADLDVRKFNNEKGLVLDSQQYYADIAASLQLVVENTILDFGKSLKNITRQENLVYAGGVALNSVANGRLVRESGFKSLFIQPAAGDSGSSLGAALSVLGQTLYEKRDVFKYKTGALGKRYSNSDIKSALRLGGVEKFIEYEDQDHLITEVVRRLLIKEVGAIFREGFEFGPRALGYRSIIADPRTADMKARVNHAVKFRELFRPFAPIVIKEAATSFFDFDPLSLDAQPFEFMMAVTKVKESKKSVLQAVTHVDGTARVQIVNSVRDPFLHRLLSKFGETTAIPVLLNTSFNRRGEPIVSSPTDAILTFMWTDLDFLVIENFLLYKGPSSSNSLLIH